MFFVEDFVVLPSQSTFYSALSSSFFPPWLRSRSERGGKKIQTGYSNRDQAILDLLIRQRKCGKLNQSGVKVGDYGRYCHCCHRGWVRRQHGQGLPEKSADLQLLCRFYFLISNLRQPPHNNMADPACGTGATQLETRPPRLQLLRAGQRDEEITHHPGAGVNPCGGGRWDRRREEERRGGPFMEEEKEGSRLSP